MSIEYKEVSSFEEIKESVDSEIINGRKNLNFIKGFEFNKSILSIDGGEDERIAKEWMSFEKPENLIFNHGQYITEAGFNHIIEEINGKPNSNRALYSLLNYDEICNKGDHPIPSFLVFQVTIEGNILYATAFFRALEIEIFLPVNLQEIKLNLQKIFSKCNLNYVNTIKFALYAFNAYKKPSQKIPSILGIDQLDPIDLMGMVIDENAHAQLRFLISEKIGIETYVSTEWVETFIKILTKQFLKIPQSNIKDNIKPLSQKLESLLGLYNRLREFRAKNSHSEEIDQLYIQANDLIEEILGLI
ncbi:hypothetical protein NQ820_04780 [Acinetobacter baumannii]|nr:hypothetical protein [Acinetobacter baumannii]MDC4661967.1 hypothetical protein [Acinetobacter baumannii]MDC4675689.1 hypothetical protein [Acinetobacter baumannii]MDC4702256.1 hypothetical protein [Acinetobacter baumannii]MDC4719015.1 hypothetical protein [Acinetobacter baumannii]